MQRGTAGAGGGGLSRFRSAPATWLEALLESDTENEVILNPSSPIFHTPNKPPPHPSTPKLPELKLETGGATRFMGDPGLFESGGSSNFLRQNSSPAEFLSHISSDGYFSNYGIPSSLDYLSPSVDVSQSAKRTRDGDSESSPRKLASQLKGESSGQLHGSGGSLDAEMDNLMDDLVPCKVRAKRGCATHPRSIAERVRRTRISDRIRKLQELVPNMDKQTNTADMLEEAVEYVKFLQRQIQVIHEFTPVIEYPKTLWKRKRVRQNKLSGVVKSFLSITSETTTSWLPASVH